MNRKLVWRYTYQSVPVVTIGAEVTGSALKRGYGQVTDARPIDENVSETSLRRLLVVMMALLLSTRMAFVRDLALQRVDERTMSTLDSGLPRSSRNVLQQQ